MADEQIVGYRRVANGDACQFCLAVDGAFVKAEDPMPLHDNCGCGVEPVTGEVPKNVPTHENPPANWPIETGAQRYRMYPDSADLPLQTLYPAMVRFEDGIWAQDARDYTAGGYKALNRALMQGDALTPEQETVARHLRGLMRDLEQPVVAYRGVDFGPQRMGGLILGDEFKAELDALGDFAEKRFQTGKTVELGGGFLSTSLDTLPALDAALSKQSVGIIFEIRCKRGAYLGSISQYDDELEFLLPDDAKFRVVGVERRALLEKDDEGGTVYRTIVKLDQL